MADVSTKPSKRPFISRLQSVRHKLREAVEFQFRTRPTSNAPIESANRHQEQQPQDHQVLDLQRDVVIENNRGDNVPQDEPGPPESEGVLSSIKEKLEQVRQENKACSWVNLSIYRIPHYLKHDEDKAYVPQIISLGPYYHGRTQLHQMEWHKWRCLDQILRRTSHEIGLYKDSEKKVEDKARPRHLTSGRAKFTGRTGGFGSAFPKSF